MNDKRFWYWINERQRIFLKKEAGESRPWTRDKILDTYKFVNVFREQDRVTRDLRDRLKTRDSMTDVFWKTVVFRLFNWPPTYDALHRSGFVRCWNEREAKHVTDAMLKRREQVFTGAYIVTNSGSSRRKNHLVCEALSKLYRDRKSLVRLMRDGRSLRRATEMLRAYPMIGWFVGYEIVTDLRHTAILRDAEDIMTWANPGPGARRGCNRIFRGQKKTSRVGVDYVEEMRTLLGKSQTGVLETHVPALEMRDIEHSLCEFDKYERVRLGEGRPRSKYR